MKSSKLFPVFIGIAVFLCSCNTNSSTTGGQNATKTSDSLNSTAGAATCVCAGKLQSPINIVEQTAIPVALPKLILVDTATSMYIKNNHETIKMTPVDTVNSKNYLILNNQRYDFVNFHFHHKSEHLINGLADSMEMHIVFQSRQSKAYAVVGALIGTNGYANPALSTLWEEFPAPGNYDQHVLKAPINLSALLNYKDTDSYYTYVGSLTTPTYGEGVAWIVLKKRLVLSNAQIIKFASYYPHNARAAFPVNNRFVFISK